MTVHLVFTAAAASYVASCGVGTAVAFGWLDTREFGWIHHVLFITTCLLAGAAVSSLLWSHTSAGWFLLPAAVPLFVLQRRGARNVRQHAAVGLAAAPFFAVSLISVWR